MVIATRQVEAEWLDALAPDDPRAMRSRRDLRRVNAWMFHAAIMARALDAKYSAAPPRALVDLGSSDGTFLLRVAHRLGPRWRGVAATLVDRQDIVSDETHGAFRALGWRVETVTADATEFLSGARQAPSKAPDQQCTTARDARSAAPHPGHTAGAVQREAKRNGALQTRDRDVLSATFDVITANLFMHHFASGPLANLLALIAARTHTFVACEPRRGLLALGASRMLWAIGGNDVTQHDAVASVRAGFAGRELSALWPRDGWDTWERPAGPFSHCFVARHVARTSVVTP